MDRAGGYLGGLLPMHRALGSFGMGNADAAIPWISRADCVRLIAFALANERWYGPLNITNPEPLTQRRFALTIAKRVRRPCWGNLPARLLRVMLGEFASALLDDQRVIPAKAVAAGFTFAHPTWNDLLRESFSSESERASCQPALAR
jgi:NAD dependent epimerase/dehydratase family enzyme